MIDLIHEHAISLTEAAKLIPSYRPGRPTSPSVITRWILAGVRTLDGRKVHLRASRCGGRWFTSREAVQEFISSQTPDVTTVPRISARRNNSERAGAECARLGF